METFKDVLEETDAFVAVKTAKERVKEIKGWIDKGTIALTRGLSNGGK